MAVVVAVAVAAVSVVVPVMVVAETEGTSLSLPVIADFYYDFLFQTSRFGILILQRCNCQLFAFFNISYSTFGNPHSLTDHQISINAR